MADSRVVVGSLDDRHRGCWFPAPRLLQPSPTWVRRYGTSPAPEAASRRRGLGKVGGGRASKPWQPPPKITNPAKASAAGPGDPLPGPPVRDIDRFNLALGLAFVVLFVVGGIWLLAHQPGVDQQRRLRRRRRGDARRRAPPLVDRL